MLPTIKGGYGSLYEPFISHKDRIYLLWNINIAQINVSTTAAATPTTNAKDLRDVINPNYLDYSFNYNRWNDSNKTVAPAALMDVFFKRDLIIF